MNTFLTAAGARTLILGWIVPSLIAISVCSFFLIPQWEQEADFAAELGDMSWAERATILGGSALILGVILNAWQIPLYRLLEGYTWPPPLRRLRSKAHQEKRRRTKARFDAAADRKDEGAMSTELERYRRYPYEDDTVMPTALGNMIRAAEYYGYERYKLDVVNLWYHVLDAASDTLREAEERARASMDFQVVSAYLSVAIAVAATATLYGTQADLPDLWLLIALPLLLSIMFYRGAVKSAGEWRTCVVAVVDLSRATLAAKLDLAIPKSLEVERSMWRVVGHVTKYPYTPARSTALAPFRRSEGREIEACSAPQPTDTRDAI